MKPFKKTEKMALLVIFSVLIIVSVPNFIISLRRARDQVRRDDLGALLHALEEYSVDFKRLPPASEDGEIMDCLNPGDTLVLNKDETEILNVVPCGWGQKPFVNLVSGRIYMTLLPRDPSYLKGAKYLYFTDGVRFQLYAAMEGEDEPEVDDKIVERGLVCGNTLCNVGRSYNVPTDISIEEYDSKLLEK